MCFDSAKAFSSIYLTLFQVPICTVLESVFSGVRFHSRDWCIKKTYWPQNGLSLKKPQYLCNLSQTICNWVSQLGSFDKIWLKLNKNCRFFIKSLFEDSPVLHELVFTLKRHMFGKNVTMAMWQCDVLYFFVFD